MSAPLYDHPGVVDGTADRNRSFVHAPAMIPPAAVAAVGRSSSVPDAPFAPARSYVDVNNTLPYVHSNAFALSPGGTKRAPLPPPNRPFLGGHSIAETGDASCIPAPVALLYRASALAIAVAALVYALTGSRHLHLDDFGSYAYFFFIAAMALAMLTSLRFCFTGSKPEKTAPSYIQGSKGTLLANLTVPVYQIALTLAVFFTPVYWAFLHSGKFTLQSFIFHLLPCAIIFVDYFLSTRMRFKIFYALISLLCVAAYLIALWIHVANGGATDFKKFDHQKQSNGKAMAYYLGTAGWAIVAAVIIYLLSALFRWLGISEDDEIAFLRDKRIYGDHPALPAIEEDAQSAAMHQAQRVLRESKHRRSSESSPHAAVSQSASQPGKNSHSDMLIPEAHQNTGKPYNSPHAFQSHIHEQDQDTSSSIPSSTAVDTAMFRPVQPAYPAYPSTRRPKSSRSRRERRTSPQIPEPPTDFDVEAQHPEL